MEIKYTKLQGSQIKLAIECAASEMEKYFDEALSANAASVNIAGFRPGKAPKAMIIESIGRQKLANVSMEQAVRVGYGEAVKKHELKPIGSPSVSILKQPSFLEKADNSFSFTVDIGVLPDVKITKDYKRIKITPLKKEELAVSDEEVEKVIDHLRRRNAGYNDITHGAREGDRVEITFKGYDGRVPVEQLTSQNHPIIMGSNTLIPGFEDKITGIKTSEERKFKLKFPKEHFAPQFRGKEFRFEVKADKVQEVVLPKIDEDFVKKFGLKSVEGLKKRLKANIAEEKKERYETQARDEVTKALTQMTRVELPAALVTSETERLRRDITEMVQKQGTTLEKYLESIKSNKEKFEEDLTRQAGNNVLVGLALREIAKLEKIKLEKEETLDKIMQWLIEINTSKKQPKPLK